jgi:hypothetical protein
MPTVRRPRFSWPLFRALVLLGIGLVLAGGEALAQRKSSGNRGGQSAAEAGGLRDFSSLHFLVHTDLDSKEANDLLRQLETELKFIATYWGRPPSGVLECYIAKNFDAWPADVVAQMDPQGVSQIKAQAGVCVCRSMSKGNRFIAKARLYAVSKDGVPLHEAVHGYCGQAFGRTGPKWYAEGMAELGHYWLNGQKGVNTPASVVKYLKKTEPREIESLIDTSAETGGTWEDYCWWWFLCHLLENNPNYSAQFRALGPELLMAKETGFREVFGSVARQLKFEYNFFLQHLEVGYRVDLTAWDWKKKFTPLTSASRTILVVVQAGRGWQPSGLTLAKGTRYQYSSTGTWRPGKGAEAVGAGGDDDGLGRLVGVVMKDYRLSQQFDLGESGTLNAPDDGNLYLRCRIPWKQLSEASGRLNVKLGLAAASSEK